MTQLKIQQGDSARIAIILPVDRMAQLQDFICKIGRFTFSFSDQTIEQVNNSNIFILNLKSNITAQLPSMQKVLIALSYIDIGVRKISEKNSLSLVVEGNVNPLNNDSISNLINATIDVLIENKVVTNNVLSVEQGDSVRLAINTPIDKLALLQDLTVAIGRFTFSLSDGTIEQDSNVFYINLKSNITYQLGGNQSILIALDYSDIGVRKLSENQVFKLLVNANSNPLNNDSVSNFVSGTINVQIVENTELTSSTIMQQFITSNPIIAEYLKGDKGDQGIQGEQGIQGIQGIQGEQGMDSATADSFEVVSKNLRNWGYMLNYTGNSLTSIVYSNVTNTITKTLNYTGGKLTSIVLSGDTPSGIDLTKTLSYTGNFLTSITYS